MQYKRLKEYQNTKDMARICRNTYADNIIHVPDITLDTLTEVNKPVRLHEACFYRMYGQLK